ncbi:ABC transporter substrate-binding protein [Vibrio sonorensis]|uniref:ABC transporter substrate-binding protein n=1 Tax=Vibrio sonorensis TaxID=1004316 RepID=UPI0008D98DE5|nr:ABC transporter substrate-binding protein [Vibrio sonorensis]
MKRIFFALTLCFSAITHASVTVESCGQPITFDAVPERMVVHDINMTEMAFALGLQDKIVGLTGITGWYKTGPEFEELRGSIPELAPKYPTMENLIAVDPDLFFAGWYYGMKPGGEVTPDTLAVQNINTLVLTESCVHLDGERKKASMDLLFDDVARLGAVFNKQKQADELIAQWREQLAQIETKVGEINDTRVFLYDSGEEKPFTAGKYAIITAMIEAAGGKNVMEDVETSWGRVAWESVAIKNPEFLVLLDYQDGNGVTKLMDFLKQHPAMKETDAVKNERFVALKYAELTPGPANIGAIEKMAKAINPDRF